MGHLFSLASVVLTMRRSNLRQQQTPASPLIIQGMKSTVLQIANERFHSIWRPIIIE
jgi:hypothetical protein